MHRILMVSPFSMAQLCNIDRAYHMLSIGFEEDVERVLKNSNSSQFKCKSQS